MKRRTALFCAVFAAAMLSGCGKETSEVPPSEIVIESAPAAATEAAMFPLKLADGTEIQSAPERVASLSPAVTEILCELGWGGKLCAVSRYCDYPGDLDLPQAGSSENPDLDRLTELAPEVLFTLSPLAEREIYALEQSGITVVKLAAPRSIEDYGDIYGTIAAVFAGEEAGTAAAEKAVSSLRTAAAAVQPCTFVYVTPKLTAAGADTFEGAVLSLCGENLCGGDGYCGADSVTEVPQYIFAADSLTASEVTAAFPELVSGGAEVVFLPAERFERPTGRLSEVFSAIHNND
ncbi:MAG: helical backbone metal receptor [Oscillospiraceae bacterium]